MAQYYQIAVGQGHQLTLEDLQRYCPNICLDGRIVVNQEDQQYGQQVVVQPADQGNDIIVSEGVQVQPQLVVSEGLQYQQQYIIRHDQPPSVQPSPQPNRPDFHQQSQGHQQQTLLRHQVYYTDLPVDAQVVLQHAPQIVDASLMQQSSTPRSQHLVNPVHVLSSPTVLHPSQQPPPQPPPPTPIPPPQHTPQSQSQQQPQQQMSRASPQLLQQLQHHQIQFQQLQQQQQQQIQQQQQLQHQLQQQQQQQQQHQTHHLQSQQIQHQQVMQTAYINQAGTPTRPPPQRLLNQALSNNGVTLVRTPVRTMRPRRPVVRNAISPAPPLQVPTRLLNPQLLQQNPSGSSPVGTTVRATMSPGPTRVRTARPASPRVLNSHAVHSQHRPPRPRTPLLQQQQQQQQQHQQQQLAQHLLGQQVQQQQLNQLKLSQQQQQIIINQNQHGQSARIITPQGTIVTQCLNQTSLQSHQNNGSLTNVATQQLQQIQQIKKVVVTPNNANEMDDLEESITAAIVQKNIAKDNMNAQFQTSPIRQTTSVSQPMNSHQINYPQHSFQQDNVLRIYESPHVQQPHVNQQHQVMMEQDTDPEERQLVTLSSGHRITIAEYKRLQSSRVLSQQHLHLQQQQPRETARQTLVKSKEQQRPVQRVHPMQTQPPTPISENNEAVSGPSEQTAEPQSAKMLIFLQNGEQRLITFTLPKESCTLQEVLEQVNVPFTEETHIQCMQNTSSEIDYFVSVGSTTRIEEMLENHPMLVGDIASRSSPSVGPQSQSSEMSTPEKVHPESTSSSPESPKSPPPRFVDGKLAVCKSCGYSGCDFNRCQRCKRVFTEEPKSVSIPNKSIEQKKKEGEKSTLDKQMPCADGIKINLLKQTVKNLNNKTAAQDKGKPRLRKPRGKQPDPEPVILTLSSDEEDSDSSMLSNQMDQNLHSKEPSLLEIEGPDSGIGFDLIDESREEISQNMTNIGTSFKCRTIRIGSYRYTPKEKIFISPRGIKIVAPTLKNESKEVALQIQIKDIVRILVHFGKGLPVIFLYTTSKCGLYIRKLLEMTDEQGPYYNPSSKVDPYKRITLLPDAISDELKTSFQTLYGSILVDLTTKEANEILVRTCPKENSICKVTTRSASASSNSGVKSVNTSEQIRQILIYPPGKGGIPINTEDYMCLAQDQFLNDVIIDFYLKYLVHDKLTASQREKTHIFSTFFYKRLTTKPSKVNKSSNPLEWDNSLTPAQKRHARVKTWTKNVNIFDKDFIVVPINENCHWFVAIICFPSLEGCRSMIDNRIVIPQATKRRERKSSMQIGNTTITPLSKQEQLTLNCDSDNLSERDEAEAEESDLDMQCDSEEDESEKPVEKKPEVPVVRKNEPIKQPCILIFDSLAGASRSRVVATLRDYLTCEYQTKISKNKVFNKDNIKGSCPKIPQQNNFTDCGLYLLQYVEQFFKDPVMDYSLPIKQLANWFDEIIVTRKREEISILLKALMNTYNPDSHLNLPDIAFPTLNGKLIETEEHADDGSGSEKSSSSKEQKCDVRSGDGSTITFVKQMATGDILVKRNFADSTETLHLRKAIRLSSESENRSVIPFKQNLIKKGDHDNQVLILRSGDLVKEIQNTLIVNKNKTVGEKKHGVHNQNVSVNCVRQSVSDSDNTFHKTRRINKMEDVMHESVKKFKKNEC